MSNEPRRRPAAPKMTDEQFERFYAEIYKEFGPGSANENGDLLRDVPVRRIPSPYDEAPEAEAEEPTVPAKKSIGGLVAVICVELLGLAGVAVWWILRLL